jgi:hypothetical protein
MMDAVQSPVQIEWKLILNDGSNATKIIPVNRENLVIGRADTADLHLDDAHISRHHARLIRQGEELLVEDLQTINGTYVNGQPVTSPYILQPGDVISLGPFTLSVEKSFIPAPLTYQEARTFRPPAATTKLGIGLLIAAVMASLIFLTFVGVGVYWFIFRNSGESADTATGALNGPTITIRQGPPANSMLPINQKVTVQAIAADPSGVTRLELWANGRKVDEVDTQLVQVAPTLNAALQWTPDSAGLHALEVRAYNEAGLVSLQLVASVTVVGEPNRVNPTLAPIPSPTIVPLLPTSAAPPTPTLIPDIPTSSIKPTPTLIPDIPTSAAPTAIAPSQAVLTLKAPILNVRTGPGTQYGWLGQLIQGGQAAILGQAEADQGKWWLIRFDAAPGGLGWVSADTNYSTASNIEQVPQVEAPPLPPPVAAAANSSAAPAPVTPADVAPASSATLTGSDVLRAPDGKTLLIVANRSLENQPALLTLSEGKSVGGGKQIDPPAGQEVQLVLEPDLYRAMWSSPARRGGLVRSTDFKAEANKIVVLWFIPEDGQAEIEVYDQLSVNSSATAVPTSTPNSIVKGEYSAPEGKVILVAANRTLDDSYAVLTVAGGSLGAGKEIRLNGGDEVPLEVTPGYYRLVWSTPAYSGGFFAGREFTVFGGEVVLTWIVPEQGQVFIQFPGYPAEQLK